MKGADYFVPFSSSSGPGRSAAGHWGAQSAAAAGVAFAGAGDDPAYRNPGERHAGAGGPVHHPGPGLDHLLGAGHNRLFPGAHPGPGGAGDRPGQRGAARGPALYLGAPLGKTLVLGIGMVGALHLLQLPWGTVAKTLALFLPLQLATGVLGLMLAKGVEQRLQPVRPPVQPRTKARNSRKKRKKL